MLFYQINDTDYLWDGIDDDDDNDGVSDSLDNCSQGTLGWISSSATDYDSDGCQDSERIWMTITMASKTL